LIEDALMSCDGRVDGIDLTATFYIVSMAECFAKSCDTQDENFSDVYLEMLMQELEQEDLQCHLVVEPTVDFPQCMDETDNLHEGSWELQNALDNMEDKYTACIYSFCTVNEPQDATVSLIQICRAEGGKPYWIEDVRMLCSGRWNDIDMTGTFRVVSMVKCLARSCDTREENFSDMFLETTMHDFEQENDFQCHLVETSLDFPKCLEQTDDLHEDSWEVQNAVYNMEVKYTACDYSYNSTASSPFGTSFCTVDEPRDKTNFLIQICTAAGGMPYWIEDVRMSCSAHLDGTDLEATFHVVSMVKCLAKSCDTRDENFSMCFLQEQCKILNKIIFNATYGNPL
jgi:hypothetical protein